jgi:hypothetical protein
VQINSVREEDHMITVGFHFSKKKIIYFWASTLHARAPIVTQASVHFCYIWPTDHVWTLKGKKTYLGKGRAQCKVNAACAEGYDQRRIWTYVALFRWRADSFKQVYTHVWVSNIQRSPRKQPCFFAWSKVQSNLGNEKLVAELSPHWILSWTSHLLHSSEGSIVHPH